MFLRRVFSSSVVLGLLLPCSTSALAEALPFYDFSTDPQLSTGWTTYVRYSGPDNSTSPAPASWNSTTQTLQLTKSVNSADNYWARGFSPNTTRLPNDTITLDVRNVAPTTNASWDWVGLSVSKTQTLSGFGTDLVDYTFWLRQDNYGNWIYRVWAKGDAIYVSSSLAIGSVLPVTMQIRRVGDDYQFWAGDALLTSDNALSRFGAGNTAMPYFAIQFGCNQNQTFSATVDNFGIVAVPEPGAVALLFWGGMAGLIWLRRRNGAPS